MGDQTLRNPSYAFRGYAHIWKLLGWGGGDPFETANRTGEAQLLTIPFSHFVESAKWALEHNGCRYHERAYFPMFHIAPTLAARYPGGHVNPTSAVSDGFISVPFLVRPDGTVGVDSWSILETAFDFRSNDGDWCDWKRKLDKLGSEMVHVSWSSYIRDGVDHGVVSEERFDAALRWQLWHWRAWLGPCMSVMAKQGMVPVGTAKGVERARAAMRNVCDDVEQRLAAGLAKSPPEHYLSGTTFGIYDLSFCTLAAFALLPPETTSCHKAAREYAAGRLPADGVHMQFLKEFRGRKAGEHGLRCYSEHRQRLPSKL